MRTIVRALLLASGFLCFYVAGFSQQVAKTIPNATSPDGLIGFLEFRPSDYGSQKHPLIIFLHGIGERGNGTSQIQNVTANAIPRFCANGASMRFTVGGQTSSFVVLSPQLSLGYGYWPTFYVKEMINYAKANLQIDPNRIYVTGLSLGGGGIWRVITEAYNFDYTYDAGIAAAAPVCGTQEESDYDFCNTIGANHLPVWAFHSMDDNTVNVASTQHAESLALNCGLSPAAKFTYYQTGDHAGAWINAYDTGHKTIKVNGGGYFTANPNLYEWFLSNTRNTTTPVYTAPVANAGIAQSITVPLSTVTLTGTGTGTNGATIASYSWTKASGPAGGIIALPLLNTTLVTGLTAGVYVFTLTVTDNHGLSSSSNVTITVNGLLAPVNQSPVSNAGGNVSITLPVNSITLDGSGSYDADGSISAYYWLQLSGPASYAIGDPTAIKTTLSNLVPGSYEFQLQVRDNAGAMGYSSVFITVNAATAPTPPSLAVNQAPISNAGPDVTVPLPTNNISLDASASYDPDGSIVAWYWVQLSGPSTATIDDATLVKPTLTNLVQGVYVFQLQVRDNAGVIGYSGKKIVIDQPPVSNAGPDVSINLPATSVSLDASGSYDTDGSLVAWYWVQISGPSTSTIANATAATTTAGNLVQGVYTFQLQVRDDAGVIGYSTKKVIVNPSVSTNQPPVSNAGANITITLPTNSVSVDGSASYDPDGSISAYYWVQTSGPSSSYIANKSAVTTTISDLIEGVYTFQLQVRDTAGAANSSGITITVKAAVPVINIPPVSNAGSNVTITLPTNSVSVDGSASTDSDGSIAAYSWTQTGGPSTATIANASVATTTISNLVQGSYTFQLQVKDNAGATNSSGITITVNAAVPVINIPPVSNAGSNVTITLPTNSVSVDGSASTDSDGSIAAYSWTQTGGPSTATIANASVATTTISNLVQGSYTFQLQVKDNAGATSNSTISITVNAAAITTAAPIGYIKLSVGQSQACDDASSDGRTPVYASSIDNGSILYLDAAHTTVFNGGWNWYSFTPALGGIVTQAFAVYPTGNITLLASCVLTTTSTPVTPSNNFLGYIKKSDGPSQACDDASASGRTAIYGTGIGNGRYLYTDAALTKKFNGGWNWFSFTQTLGGPTNYAFAVYPTGIIGLLRICTTNGAVAASLATAAQDQAMLTALRDSATMVLTGTNLKMYPNPVHTTATIELYSTDNSVKTINVYYSNGVLKAKYTWQTVKGNNTFLLNNIAGLANGLYIIDIRDSDGKQNGKLKFIKL